MFHTKKFILVKENYNINMTPDLENLKNKSKKELQKISRDYILPNRSHKSKDELITLINKFSGRIKNKNKDRNIDMMKLVDQKAFAKDTLGMKCTNIMSKKKLKEKICTHQIGVKTPTRKELYEITTTMKVKIRKDKKKAQLQTLIKNIIVQDNFSLNLLSELQLAKLISLFKVKKSCKQTSITDLREVIIQHFT